MTGLEITCAAIVALVMILALVGTFIGMCRGKTIDWLNWHFNAGEWMKLLAQCIVVLAAALRGSDS